jgi:hypothetical protein
VSLSYVAPGRGAHGRRWCPAPRQGGSARAPFPRNIQGGMLGPAPPAWAHTYTAHARTHKHIRTQQRMRIHQHIGEAIASMKRQNSEFSSTNADDKPQGRARIPRENHSLQVHVCLCVENERGTWSESILHLSSACMSIICNSTCTAKTVCRHDCAREVGASSRGVPWEPQVSSQHAGVVGI